MLTKEIPAAVRAVFGKGEMRRLRAAGKTPGIVYSGGNEALPLSFETKLLYNQLLDLQGRNAVITLTIDDGTSKNVLLKEVQTDPVKESLYHTDFLEIDLEQEATFSVPVIYKGKAKGVDLGGILEINHTEIELRGLPMAIPDECVVNISGLAIGGKVSAGDISLPENVSLVTRPDQICVAVSAP